jgi:UDP:flavonoid glycosyltransferase YjiC (YdhE family)
MADILFVTWDGGGNVPPAVGIGHELRRRGHAVRFLGHGTQEHALVDAGFEFVRPTHARPFSSQQVHSGLSMLGTFADRGMGRDLLTEVRRRPVDLVVVDCLMVGAMHAAHAAGLRFAVLEHLYDEYLRSAVLAGPMGWNLRVRRLRPHAALDAAAVRVVTSLPDLDPLAGRATNIQQVGPVVPAAAPADFVDPTVLVSLSTYAYAGMQRSLQSAVDAASGLEARVVVTTGPVIEPTAIRARPGVEVLRYVPHAEVMPASTLFVGHGGHGGTMTALAHDLPVVLMPMYDRADQPLVARSVERAGAGRVVHRTAGPAELEPVLAQMLADGPHRRAAARLGARVRAHPGAIHGADALEAALPTGSPPRAEAPGRPTA